MGERPQNSTILIVDDTPANLHLLVRMLKTEGYIVRPTTNGEFGLAFARSAQPDLILLDIKMPKMSGYEVCAQLKADERTRDIPVIFISAMDQAQEKMQAFAVGGVDFITRPFQTEEVLARVQTHLALSQLQKVLASQNEMLEQRVKERTAELMAANETLQVEIGRRQEAEEALRKEQASLARRVAEQTADLSKVNAELVKAVRLKDEFLATVSHELRTPLNAVLGMSEILREGLHGPLNAKQVETVDYIEEAGRHLLTIINDILDLSKIEADKLDLRLEAIAVEDVFRASLSFIRSMAQKKGLKVASTFDHRVTLLQADRARLRQMLINLLNNAVKFTPEGGQIGLEVEGDAQQGKVNFIVWDTGIGIPTERMGELFKPFRQLDARLTRQYGGTGLGLALVAHLVELHGGGISVESQVGRGSRFMISLPWSGLDEGGEKLDLPEKAAGERRPLVLLAEDHEANIATISGFLTSRYQLLIARNGVEAIEQAQEEAPDVILMDIQMPVMDGLDAISRLRLDNHLKHIPIIALTAFAMPGDRERCLAAGANVYLSKPVSKGGLLKAIEGQLSSHNVIEG